MRRPYPLAAILLLAALSTQARAHDSDCASHKDENVRIKSCSELIGADPRNATAYHSRGGAYRTKGDVERAIADYSKAIELKPTNAAAYNDRALVYATKGDYSSALADVTRANELSKQARSKDDGPRARLSTSTPKQGAAPPAAKPKAPMKAVSASAPAGTELPSWAKESASQN